jgi:histidinol-phosphate aminotransferase
MHNRVYSKIHQNIFRPDWLYNEIRHKNKLWLDKNENTDKKLTEFIKKIFNNLDICYFNSYPNLSKLYLKLSKFLKISPEEILLTNGSDGGIRAVFETFINPNDLVVRTEPTFAMYSIYCKIYKTKEILIKYNKELCLDIGFILKTIKSKKPKLVCLPNPDSPTGQIIEEKLIKKILAEALKSKTFVLIDEAYFEYYQKTFIYKINNFPNLIIVRTSGKAYGLSGARIGYLISNKKIIKKLHQTKSMYEVNYVGAELFFQLLKKNNNNFIQNIVKEHLIAKTFFENKIKKLGYNIIKTYSNFVIVDFKKNTKEVLARIKKLCYFKYFCEGPLKGKARFSLTNFKNFKKILKLINYINEKN